VWEEKETEGGREKEGKNEGITLVSNPNRVSPLNLNPTSIPSLPSSLPLSLPPSLQGQVKGQIWGLLLAGLGLAGVLDLWAGHTEPTILGLSALGSFISYIYSAPPLKLKQVKRGTREGQREDGRREKEAALIFCFLLPRWDEHLP